LVQILPAVPGSNGGKGNYYKIQRGHNRTGRESAVDGRLGSVEKGRLMKRMGMNKMSHQSGERETGGAEKARMVGDKALYFSLYCTVDRFSSLAA
jgi:hypothetical protein